MKQEEKSQKFVSTVKSYRQYSQSELRAAITRYLDIGNPSYNLPPYLAAIGLMDKHVKSGNALLDTKSVNYLIKFIFKHLPVFHNEAHNERKLESIIELALEAGTEEVSISILRLMADMFSIKDSGISRWVNNTADPRYCVSMIYFADKLKDIVCGLPIPSAFQSDISKILSSGFEITEEWMIVAGSIDNKKLSLFYPINRKRSYDFPVDVIDDDASRFGKERKLHHLRLHLDLMQKILSSEDIRNQFLYSSRDGLNIGSLLSLARNGHTDEIAEFHPSSIISALYWYQNQPEQHQNLAKDILGSDVISTLLGFRDKAVSILAERARIDLSSIFQEVSYFPLEYLSSMEDLDVISLKMLSYKIRLMREFYKDHFDFYVHDGGIPEDISNPYYFLMRHYDSANSREKIFDSNVLNQHSIDELFAQGLLPKRLTNKVGPQGKGKKMSSDFEI